MKPFEAQSYYELLEISVSARTEEIQEAYQRLSRQYADDQVALYGLVESGSAAQLRARLLEAMEILCDDDLRLEYDRELGLPPRAAPQRVDDDEDDQSSAQMAMTDLLQLADRAVHSTHPRVAFAYVDEVPVSSSHFTPPHLPVVAPLAPPPEPERAPQAASPAPAMSPPQLVSATVQPETNASLSVQPERSLSPPVQPERSTTEVEGGLPTGAVAEHKEPMPRPLPEVGPTLAQDQAIDLAESQLAKVSKVAQAAREARAASDPPPRPPPPQIAPDAEFNGELLRTVRQAAGLSLQQLADKTRIGARHLENVEADRYAALPAAVYLRGILMNLSRELGLDGLKVSKSYLGLVERAKSKG